MTNPYLIGVCGGSASGKSKIMDALQLDFSPNELAVVSMDNYYRDKKEQQKDANGKINFDLPSAIDFDLLLIHLTDLLEGMPVHHYEYQFQVENPIPKPIVIVPAPIVIIEGLFVFHQGKIRDLLQLKVMVQTELEVMYQRRLKRDLSERGVPENLTTYQWESHVLPAFEKYVKPYFQNADIVLVNNSNYHKGLQLLSDHLKTRLRY